MHKTAFSPNGMIGDKAVQWLIEEARKLANIKQEIPLAQVVDFTMLKEAQKDLGIK
ncbi:MAG: hypothetical protein HYX88_00200 [Chloroflexi bacterium]|nr:hypothetical protein [Chloroflexota bacterium]